MKTTIKILIAILSIFLIINTIKAQKEINYYNNLNNYNNIASSDECDTAINVSAAFSVECEMIGPFEQGGATVSSSEPPLPSCFADGYNGTTWYSFIVPNNIAGGNPTDFIVSTGAYADCTSNPLNGNANTQLAIYEGLNCPNGNAVAIACNEDYSSEPPYVSSVQVTLTPGDQYYIMVNTLGSLSGEFCFYVQPVADFFNGGTTDCTNCGDGICNGVIGERFANCTTDCPCDAYFVANSIDENGIPHNSLNYEAYCPEAVGGSGNGVYIPFSIGSSNVPQGPDGVTFLNSTLTVTIGSIYNYVFGGSPRPLTSATQNIDLIYLTPTDIIAVQGGHQIVLNFIDESGLCNIADTITVDLNVQCGNNQVFGCIDSSACNYNAEANVNDGSCEYNCDISNVYPGDLNHDGIVNNQDVSLSGLFKYQSGIARDQEHQNTDWYAHPAQDWNIVNNQNIDIKHHDCNGDGTIDEADQRAVEDNMGLIWSEQDTITPPDESDYQVMLHPIDEIYDGYLVMNVALERRQGGDLTLQGGHFTVDYSDVIGDFSQADIQPFPSSWLGINEFDLWFESSTLVNDQKIEVGFTKTNNLDSEGNGIIGQLILLYETGAAKKANVSYNFEVNTIGVHQNNGDFIPIEDQQLEIIIDSDICYSNLVIDEQAPFQNLYKSSNTITTNGLVLVGENQEVEYKANRVRINSGFTAKAGAYLKVRTGGCN